MSAARKLEALPLPPRCLALRDYQDGEGLDHNPFPKGTQEHEDYAWAMHELWSKELDRIADAARMGL